MDTDEAKMLIDALHRDYPKLDQMQVETLVWAYLKKISNHLEKNEDHTQPLPSFKCLSSEPRPGPRERANATTV